MLCSTTMMVVPRRSLISATFENTSRTMMGARAEGGLVEQEQFGGCHEATAEGEHLLLSSGHLAGVVAALFVEDGEQFHDGVEAASLFRAVVEVDAAHLEVFGDGQVGEDAAALGYKGDAFLDDFVGLGGQGLLAPVDGTVHHGGEAHDGLEDGGLASPVGSHDGDDLAGVDAHGDVGEGAHGAVLDGYVGEFEEWRGSVDFHG